MPGAARTATVFLLVQRATHNPDRRYDASGLSERQRWGCAPGGGGGGVPRTELSHGPLTSRVEGRRCRLCPPIVVASRLVHRDNRAWVEGLLYPQAVVGPAALAHIASESDSVLSRTHENVVESGGEPAH